MYSKLIKFLFVSYFYATHPGLFILRLKCEADTRKIKLLKHHKKTPLVSIIIVTFNAYEFTEHCMRSLRKTNYPNKEIIVVDNNSNEKTKTLLKRLKKDKFISKLYLSTKNHFFSKGNNIGFSLVSPKSEYIVLLNNDIEIKNSFWLDILVSQAPTRGIISFGKVDVPLVRPDGWCFMIDKKTFKSMGMLNDFYQMSWSITELTGKVLQDKLPVFAIKNPDDYVYHFGQKNVGKKGPMFNEMSMNEVIKLFNNNMTRLLQIT